MKITEKKLFFILTQFFDESMVELVLNFFLFKIQLFVVTVDVTSVWSKWLVKTRKGQIKNYMYSTAIKYEDVFRCKTEPKSQKVSQHK